MCTSSISCSTSSAACLLHDKIAPPTEQCSPTKKRARMLKNIQNTQTVLVCVDIDGDVILEMLISTKKKRNEHFDKALHALAWSALSKMGQTRANEKNAPNKN